MPNNITNNACLNLSKSSRQKQHYRILNPTKCPTKTCKDCKVHYVDKLGLDIFVICNCKCHKKKLELKHLEYKKAFLADFNSDELKLKIKEEEVMVS